MKNRGVNSRSDMKPSSISGASDRIGGVRASRIWKSLPLERRVEAATAFWKDDESPDVQMQHMEALVAIAQRMNFRTRSVQAFSPERRANALARIPDVSDAVAMRALVAFHFEARRDLMGAFLDALGVEHDHGMISDEDGIAPPDAARLARAVVAVRGAFPDEDVDLYLRTLLAVDQDTWAHLRGVVPESA